MKNNYLRLLIVCAALFLFQSISSAQVLPWAWVEQTYSGPSSNTGGVAIDNTNQVLYVSGTYTYGPVDFGQGIINGSGHQDIYLAKYSLLGQLLWVKTMGNQNNSLSDLVKGLAVDPSGNVYMAGYTSYDSIRFGSTLLADAVTGSSLGFLAKFDANGNPLWAVGGIPQSGGSLCQQQALTTDASGNVYVTGVIAGSALFGSTTLTAQAPAAASMYEIKYNSSGTVVWTQMAAGYTDGWPSPNSIALDGNGNSIIAGNYGGTSSTFGTTVLTNTNSSFDDRFVTKLDPSGTFLWAKTSGFWQGPDVNNSVTVDAQNNIYLAGTISDPIYGSNNSGYAAAYFLEKLDANGDSTWYVGDTFNISNAPFSVIDSAGNNYLVISTGDTTWSFGSQSGIVFPPPSGLGTNAIGTQTLVIKYNNAGAAQWIQNTAPAGATDFAYTNQAEAAALDSRGNLYVSGFFADTIAFGPIIKSNSQNNDFYIAKMGYGATGIHEETASDMSYTIYPNPSNGQFQVHFTGNIENAEVRLYDMLGNMISYIESGSAANVTINKQGQLAPGAYLCRVTTLSSGSAAPAESSHMIIIE